jgi:hypothetical protein
MSVSDSCDSDDYSEQDEPEPIVNDNVGNTINNTYNYNPDKFSIDEYIINKSYVSKKTKLTKKYESDDDLAEEKYEDEDVDEEEKVLTPNLAKKMPSVSQKKISTEGSTQKIQNLVFCSICNKWYDDEMFIPMATDTDEPTCLHCYFWLNYDESTRKIADTQYEDYGISIVNYITMCHEAHKGVHCTRITDNGMGCYLCEYNLGLPLTGIKNLDTLYGEASCGNTIDIATDPLKSEQHESILLTHDDKWIRSAYSEELKKSHVTTIVI